MINILTSFFFPFIQKISPSLSPKRGLKKLDNSDWLSTDNDPQFIARSLLFNVLSGWISVRVKIDSGKAITPKLYIDFGEGYSERRVVHLRLIEEDIYQAELVIPSAPKSIRFDPDESPGIFSLSMFQIKAHSEILHSMHQFIAIMKHDHHKGEDSLRIYKKSYARYKKHGLFGMIERLEKEYKMLHPYKVQRSSSQYTTYLNWIRENEHHNNEEFDESLFDHTPLISIIMATYDTPVEYLKKALDSVLEQSYPHWELCIADDASNDTEVLQLLTEYMKNNERINVHFRTSNGNISLASNSALALAKGDYIALMDHDDMLAPNALLEVLKAINSNPKTKFIYSDEDKIDEKDRRYDPHFKSGWNPDMFYSQNYISHLSVIKKSLLDEVGIFREGYEGAQDYDLFLRVAEVLSTDEIIHIEKILYHWRAFEGSSAFDPEAKHYTSEAGLRALKDHFSSSDEAVNVEHGLLPNTYKVSYPLHEEPLVSLIIPTRDGYDILSLCIKSIIEKTSYENYEIIIVDNQTTDAKTLAYFDELTNTYQHIKIIHYDKPFNYSAINNFAVEHANANIIGLINNDVEVISDHWLSEMVQHALRPNIGAVGAKLYYDNNTIQHAGIILGIGGVAGHSHKYFAKDTHGYFSRLKIIQNFSAVTGACLVVKKELYKEVGGLNTENLKIAFNDVDFCLKLQKKGYRNLWTPYVELFHHESVSRGKEDNEVKRLRFEQEVNFMKNKWESVLEEDVYYNKNLTKKHESFEICSSKKVEID